MSILPLQLYLLINEYDEHVACLNEHMFVSAMYMKGYASSYVLRLKFLSFQHNMHVHVHGAIFLYVWC